MKTSSAGCLTFSRRKIYFRNISYLRTWTTTSNVLKYFTFRGAIPRSFHCNCTVQHIGYLDLVFPAAGFYATRVIPFIVALYLFVKGCVMTLLVTGPVPMQSFVAGANCTCMSRVIMLAPCTLVHIMHLN